MTAKKESKDGGEEKPRSKTPTLIHLTHETMRRLRKAADDEGVSNSVYVEQTLRARFKKDGVD